jgi:acetoin utilization deacetylase AcuC-like enzyme
VAAETGLISHSGCLEHAPPPGHPESPDRLRAVLAALETGFDGLRREQAVPASRDALLAAHTAPHIDAVLGRLSDDARRNGGVAIDADTFMSPGSAEAAVLAAGAVVLATQRVANREMKNAFCAVRPPGHHAPANRAMGFCLFNNVAIGAFEARRMGISERIAVIDFDVHHGNGTQDIFFGDANLFYASTHQSPLYPGTGSPREHGIANNILNVPLAPYSGSKEFRSAMTNEILPALEDFKPGFIFISAGFDAHDDDPLAQLRLTDEDFGWATSLICGAAAKLCAGRVVSTLEGGYDLDALGRSAAAHVRALMEA